MKKQTVMKGLAIFFFLVSVFQIINNLTKIILNRDLLDFLVYWQVIDKFLAGKNVYHFLYSTPLNKIPYYYPPSALLVLLPLKIFPLKIIQILWIVFSFISLWFSLWVVMKLAKIKLKWPHFLIILAFFNQTFPVKLTLVLGQINLIVLGLVFGGLYLYFNNKTIGGRHGRAPNSTHCRFIRQSTGGKGMSDRIYRFIISVVLFSFASAIKIFPLLTLPIFLFFKDYLFVFLVLAVFLILNLIPGINLFYEYYFKVFPSLNAVTKPNFYDQSIIAFLLRLNIPPLTVKIISIVSLLAIMSFIFVRFRRFSVIKLFSIMLALSSIFGPYSWQHHLVFAYPLIFFMYLKNFKKNKFVVNLMFIFIWLIMAFHFNSEKSLLLNNPFLASYQTITILVLIIANLC